MADPRPGPGEELNPGTVTEPRHAASVVLLRGGAERLEVLLVRRNPEQRFMGGAWVFPGGALDREDGAGEDALRVTALRELAEEASVVIEDRDALVPYSRWITPEVVRVRFDTRFFLIPAPADADPQPDGAETVAARWIAPADALEAHTRDELTLVFPTIKHLEQFAGFDSADALLAHARVSEVQPVLPKVIDTGETARIVLPGEPGYDA
jgi:8-oxo-dGTP pyrophosphatase MutT (NUDIX family)